MVVCVPEEVLVVGVCVPQEVHYTVVIEHKVSAQFNVTMTTAD